jgi:hypothetical protein
MNALATESVTLKILPKPENIATPATIVTLSPVPSVELAALSAPTVNLLHEFGTAITALNFKTDAHASLLNMATFCKLAASPQIQQLFLGQISQDPLAESSREISERTVSSLRNVLNSGPIGTRVLAAEVTATLGLTILLPELRKLQVEGEEMGCSPTCGYNTALLDAATKAIAALTGP